jgi:hypothetical protein
MRKFGVCDQGARRLTGASSSRARRLQIDMARM